MRLKFKLELVKATHLKATCLNAHIANLNVRFQKMRVKKNHSCQNNNDILEKKVTVEKTNLALILFNENKFLFSFFYIF